MKVMKSKLKIYAIFTTNIDTSNTIHNIYLSNEFAIVADKVLFQTEDERRSVTEMEDPWRRAARHTELNGLGHEHVGNHVHGLLALESWNLIHI